jgi:hypothetical protein
VLSSIAGLMRLASVVICLIVIASFTIFAVDQTKGASVHQQQELTVGTRAATSSAPKSTPAHEGAVHEAIDEASNKLTSPFSGVTSGSSSEWAIHGVNLLLALAIYGFGLGYLARVIRVRFP